MNGISNRANHNLGESMWRWIHALQDALSEIFGSSVTQMADRVLLIMLGTLFLSFGWGFAAFGAYRFLTLSLSGQASIALLAGFHLFTASVCFLLIRRRKKLLNLSNQQEQKLELATHFLKKDVEREIKSKLNLKENVAKNPRPWVLTGFLIGIWLGKSH